VGSAGVRRITREKVANVYLLIGEKGLMEEDLFERIYWEAWVYVGSDLAQKGKGNQKT